MIGSTRSSCGQAVRGDLPEDRLATITLGNASTGRPRIPAAAADAHEIGWSSQLTARCVHWRQPEVRTHSVTCAATAVRGCDPIVRAKTPMASDVAGDHSAPPRESEEEDRGMRWHGERNAHVREHVWRRGALNGEVPMKSAGQGMPFVQPAPIIGAGVRRRTRCGCAAPSCRALARRSCRSPPCLGRRL